MYLNKNHEFDMFAIGGNPLGAASLLNDQPGRQFAGEWFIFSHALFAKFLK